MTKIRIISDLHYTAGINGPDHNKTYKKSGLWHYFGKHFQEYADITLIAGDICEGVDKHQNFFESFFPNQKIIFIEGNHLPYFILKDGSCPVLSDLKQQFKTTFSKVHPLYNYLENDWIWISNNNDVAVIGSTFYTDYKYCDLTLEEFNEKLKSWDFWMQMYGINSKFEPYTELTTKIIQKETMSEAAVRLNDFKWGNENKFTKLSPEYYLKLHKLAKKEVKRCYDEILAINPNAKIILLTHHCLSPNVISEKYKKGLLNASYTSNLESWITKMPNIKLVVSGHVHNRNDFTFGKNKTRYILNPCGYIPYNEPFGNNKFNPNLIIDTNDL